MSRSEPLLGDTDTAVEQPDFASYCPHCHTGGPGEDDYCGSCGEYIETGCAQCGEPNCMEVTHDA